jgi:hypothetical protein
MQAKGAKDLARAEVSASLATRRRYRRLDGVGDRSPTALTPLRAVDKIDQERLPTVLRE